LIYIPSNSHFSSLNISHAVSLICWEFFKFFNDLILDQNSNISLNTSPTIKDMDYFYKNLCEKLNNSGFFHSDFMKKSIMENIKVLFNRAELSSQEIKTLNGIIKSLYEYNKQA
jgi:tRNA/rRNA methyltransferase